MNESFEDLMKTRKAYVKERNKFTKLKTYLGADEIKNTIDHTTKALYTISKESHKTSR